MFFDIRKGGLQQVLVQAVDDIAIALLAIVEGMEARSPIWWRALRVNLVEKPRIHRESRPVHRSERAFRRIDTRNTSDQEVGLCKIEPPTEHQRCERAGGVRVAHAGREYAEARLTARDVRVCLGETGRRDIQGKRLVLDPWLRLTGNIVTMRTLGVKGCSAADAGAAESTSAPTNMQARKDIVNSSQNPSDKNENDNTDVRKRRLSRSNGSRRYAASLYCRKADTSGRGGARGSGRIALTRRPKTIKVAPVPAACVGARNRV
jgi:hypothetical protein